MIKVEGVAKSYFNVFYVFRREYIDLKKVLIWPPTILKFVSPSLAVVLGMLSLLTFSSII